MTIFLAIIFLSIILLSHELGHFLLAKASGVEVEEFGFGFPPKIVGKKFGNTEYSLNWLPFGGFNKINEESFDRQPVGRRALILSGGVIANFILGWIFLVLVFMIGSKPLVIIGDLAPNSPAALSGLQKNDEIVSVIHQDDVLNSPFSSQNFIDFTSRFKGQPITLKINRAGKTLDFQITGRLNPPAGEGSLGLVVIDAGSQAQSFGQSLIDASKFTGQVTLLTFSSLYDLVTKAFSQPALLNSLTGPIGAVALAGQVGKIGFTYLLQIMAFLSLGFAVFNILPFPGLDGGHLFFTLIEKFKGSPVSIKIRGWSNACGLGFLLLLMVFITVKDIKSLL